MAMNEKRVIGSIKLENAKLIYRNFRGEAGKYNKEGNKNFGVILPRELAEELIDEGWKVKVIQPKEEEGGEQIFWLPVKAKFTKVPPIVMLITNKGKVKLDEETIGQLDYVSIVNADIIINPYNYPAMQGRPAGVSAYLKALYVTIAVDEFAEKYEDLPEIE